MGRGICRPLIEMLDRPLAHWFKLSVSPEGRLLAASSERGVELWDLQTQRRLSMWTPGMCSADFDAHGDLIIACSEGVFRWPRRAEASAAAGDVNHSTLRFGPPARLTDPVVATSVSVSDSGELLAFETAKGWAVLQPGKSPAPVSLQTTGDPRKSAVSGDNRYVAIGNWDNAGVGVWDALTGEHVSQLQTGPHAVVQFSPDGSLLAATPDGVTLWRTSDWQRTARLHAVGNTPTGLGLAFSPDGRVLALGQPNGILRLVDPSSGHDWAQITQGDLNVASILAFSPDKRWLVSSSIDERLPAQIWNLAAVHKELACRRLDLPPDVLRPDATVPLTTERLDVLLDDGGLQFRIQTAVQRREANRMLRGSANFLQRSLKAVKEKAAR
jgi:WD40 repeat protein